MIPSNSLIKTTGYPSCSYSDIPQMQSECFATVSQSDLQTLAKAYFPTPNHKHLQSYKSPYQTNTKLFTPLIPHKTYRTVQSFHRRVIDTATDTDGVSESNT